MNAVQKGKKKYWQQTNQFNSNKTSNSQTVKQNIVKLATGVALSDMGHVIAEFLRITLVINMEIWDA